MIRHLSFTLFLLLALLEVGGSQKTVLRVLGQYSYSPEKMGTMVEIEFVENINNCDPVNGYRTLEDQEYAFEQSLKKKGISFKKFEKEDNLSKLYKGESETGVRKSIFRYLCQSSKESKDIYYSAQRNFASKVKVWDKAKEHDFEEEDEKAVLAIRDAKERASYIAQGLDMKLSEIISVDDITDLGIGAYASYYAELMLSMSEDMPLDMLSSRYSIWVTFELTP